MKKYFYSDGTNNFGPFTLEELKEKRITRETMIWFQELVEWQKAGTIKELNNLFALTPPPIKQGNIYNQQTIEQASSNNTTDMFVFLSIVYWFATDLLIFILQKFVDNWYDSPAKYFQIGTNIVYAVIPIVLQYQSEIKN